jgi:hypothetical protein
MKKVYPKRKKHLTITPADLYLRYVDDKEGDRYVLSYNKWKSIIFTFLEEVYKLMIRENLVYDLPHGMGRMGIVKKKSSIRKRIDYAATKQHNKLIFHRNLHTDGYYFCFIWLRGKRFRRKGENIKYYKFFPVLDAKNKQIGARGLAAWVKECANNPFIKDYDAPTMIV